MAHRKYSRNTGSKEEGMKKSLKGNAFETTGISEMKPTIVAIALDYSEEWLQILTLPLRTAASPVK